MINRDQDNRPPEFKETLNNFSTSYCRAVHNAVNPYTQMRNETIRDPSLSFAALGLLTYIFSNADTWEILPQDIWTKRMEGRDKIYGLFNELIEAGYAYRMMYEVRKNGRFNFRRYGYAFFEVKATLEDLERVYVDFKNSFRNRAYQDYGSQDSENQDLYNKQGEEKNIKQNQQTPRATPTPKVEEKARVEATPRSLFSLSRPWMKILNSADQLALRKYYADHQDEPRDVERWLMNCARNRYWEQRGLSPEERVQKNQAFGKRIEKCMPTDRIYAQYGFLEFLYGPCAPSTVIEYSEPNFVGKCRKQLKKMGLPIPEWLVDEHTFAELDDPD